jgi:hypothetical protein
MVKSASQTNKNNRERGKAFEDKMARFLGWWRIPYSGSSELFGLGDIRDSEDKSSARYMGECKSITPKSVSEINYIIKEKWLVGKDSVVARAKKENNKFPVLLLTKAKSPLSFAIIRDTDFKMCVDALELLRRSGFIDDTRDVDSIRAQIWGHFPAEVYIDEESEN